MCIRDRCYVSLNYAEELASFQGNEKQFPLPDGQALTVASQQIAAAEMLFTPSIMDSTSPGLQQIVYKVMMDCEFESRKDLYSNLSLIHISEPTRLLSISYAVFCLKKKKKIMKKAEYGSNRVRQTK
eukprot:TRINITY_DN26356_c0_g1_i4.p1 TRINITY_DN26356_c0_g1~~TRINITY_DN26356_c0_g1_i4.p1  ORF type:complete len:127 (+),score=44.04 TRINITY_DN26356_c0_g1_i4:146-526(+)